MQSLVALIDGSDSDGASLRAAAIIAKAIGGELTVAQVKGGDALPIGSFDMGVMPNISVATEEAVARARAAYDDECGDLAYCRLEEVDAGISETVERVSPYHDLVVLGRLSGSDGSAAMAFSAALWSVGCAVLVTPAAERLGDKVGHVAVAWNGSVQAGRALRAALPFLRRAGQVTVLQRHGITEDGELKRYLAMHDIEAVHFRTYGEPQLTGRGWGRALLSATSEIGADLLVMGAYGSAMGNLLGFGRATEKIVTSATLPVLLSA
jgi:nucleotide-binding universal stress UspA family protein